MKQECKDCNKSLEDCACIEDTVELPNQTLINAAERLKNKELFKESNDRARQALSEIKSLPIQERYEKYSERFDNYKSEIGNPDTWGKRVVKEPKQEISEQETCNFCGKTLREQMKGCSEITCYRQFLPKQETLEDIKLEEVLGSSYCKYTVIENKLAIIYRNQEKILSAIKLLSNEK